MRVVALRSPGTDAYGKARIEALVGARFARTALDGVQWATAAAAAAVVVNDTSTELTARFAGPSKEFAALDLAAEPDLAAVLNAVDLDELTS